MDKTLYFDNAATTFPKPECVYTTMDEVNRNFAVNAGRGSYALGKKATSIIDEVRTELLKKVNGQQVAEVVITPSATIALNQIIMGLNISEKSNVYVTSYEHNAVIRPLNNLPVIPNIIQMPVNSDYTIDIDKLKYLFSKNPPDYVVMTHVSNVIGYICPIGQISMTAKEYNAKIIVDASQSLGLINIDLVKYPIDYLVFAGHKTLYGPFGIGGFYIRKGNELKAVLAGGTGSDSLNPKMPDTIPGKYEPASPNILACAGLLASLLESQGKENSYLEQEKKITRYICDKLSSIKEVIMYLPPDNYHVGIIAFNIKGYLASEVGEMLDDKNVAVRTGYHCAPYVHQILHDEEFAGVVRTSIGRFTTMDEVEMLVEKIKEVVEE